MTRHYGLGGETTQQKAARLESSRLPPTNDALRTARAMIIGAIIGGIMWAIFVICIFWIAGVVE